MFKCDPLYFIIPKLIIMKKLFILLLVSLSISIQAQISNTPQSIKDYEDAALYVKFKPSVAPKLGKRTGVITVSTKSLPIKAELSQQYKLAPEAKSYALKSSSRLQGLYRIDLENDSDVDLLINDLLQDSNVLYAERVPMHYISSETKTSYNDPFYGTIAGINLRWHWDLINAEAALSLQQANASVRISIVDNAVWSGHEDLTIEENNQWNVQDLINNSNPPEDISQNCSEEELQNEDCDAYSWSHGTHCAGIVSAHNNNNLGIMSLGSGATLMGAACGTGNGTFLEGTAEGIVWSIDNGADIINCSFGSSKYSNAVQDILTAAAESNVIIIAAAGNERASRFSYPAAYMDILSVGSCDYDKRISSFSNYGNWVDVLAPGGAGPEITGDYPNAEKPDNSIFSTTFSPNYTYSFDVDDFEGKYYDGMSGTSMAAPVVSSLVALMKSKDSTLNLRDIRHILMTTAMETNGDSRIINNSGIIDAEAAIRAIDTYEPFLEPISLKSINAETEAVASVKVTIAWEVDTNAEKPDFFRVYKDNILLHDSIDANSLYATDSIMRNSRPIYEVSELRNGKESYRLETLLQLKTPVFLGLTVNPPGAGKVYGAGTHTSGSKVLIQAKSNPGYSFSHWEDGFDNELFSSEDSLVININKQMLLIAMFNSESTTNQKVQRVQNIKIFPNPIKNVFSIEIEDKSILNSVHLVDIRGVIMRKIPVSNIENIDISNFKSGIYFLVFDIDSEQQIYKLIKQ